MTKSPITPSRRSSIRKHLLAGMAAVVLLTGGVGGWAASTEISGAVIAPGLIVVDSNSKRIQHPTGGVVGEILVRDGQRVQAGDVLIRLDQTQTQARLRMVTSSLDELQARQARLEAERDGTAEPVFPEELTSRANVPEVARLIEGERKLFQLRLETRTGQKSQLRERIDQLRQEIEGVTAQSEAKAREIELVQEELKGVRDLWEKKLVQINRLTEMERNAARLEGERAQLVAATAQARGRIAETELQIIEIDQSLRSEVGAQIADIRARISELSERRVAAEDELKRIDLRAPQDGTVHQLSVHTIGGVVQPGETLMLLVPFHDTLTVEARIAPHEIDRVRAGHDVGLRFTALNQRTTPELTGTVSRVSADVSEDPKSGATFYTVRIAVPPSEIERLDGVTLVPGMPVEAFIQTDERTVLTYFVKPLRDQLSRAFRER